MTTTHPDTKSEIFTQADELETELKKVVEGEVRFDKGSRALYATDASNYRQVPIGVVIPKSKEDIVKTFELCRRFKAPVLSRGGGTSLAGQCCNVAVILDMSKYFNRLLHLDAENKSAVFEPGLILDQLRDAAEKHHLTFAPDPATHNHCTLGGMIGNNSCGVHSVMGGKTVDNIDELEIILYDGTRMRVGATTEEELENIIADGGRRGEIYSRLKALRDKYGDKIRQKYPDIPRRVSGYNLDQLLPENGFNVARALVGSESTLVCVLEAKGRLMASPPVRSLLVLGYPDVYSAGDRVPEIMKAGPVGLEGIDDGLIKDMTKKGLHPQDAKLLPDGKGWLLVEFGGDTKEEADGKAHKLMEQLKQDDTAPSMKLYDDAEEEALVWEIRESGLGATADVPGRPLTWTGWEDAAIPPDKVGDYLRDFKKLLDKYHYTADLYGHFGQGCIHCRIDFDLETHEGIEKYRSFIGEAAEVVVGYGGSISGEHGDGQARAALLPIMFGDELIEAFQEFKSIWDPDWKMNPGKVVDPYQPTENLRLGTDYNPWSPETEFSYPDDDHDFSRSALRCVGVGKCRRLEGGTMCPSFMVTREEKDSTRGRSRLLFEMLGGEVLTDGWRDESVRDALDLCLACKGCKGDCPVNVDMATYKAEFLSHYYKGRLRPMSAYSMGLIYWWARMAAPIPWLANFFTQSPIFAPIMKKMGGIAPQRKMPVFSDETFKDWFNKREKHGSGKRVMLWPDTFNNHFFPAVLKAAVEILESNGCEVVIPQVSLCCGRPLYDFGMVKTAKHLLRQILTELRQDIRDGTPLVGLEPSCVAVFRDELTNLFPNDKDAKRLSQQTFDLSEFLRDRDFQPPKLNRKAIVHGHCHQQAIVGMDAEKEILKRLGLDFEILDSGCCGMAGSFGFETQHYDISVQVGERVLLPKVENLNDDSLIIANGFSCREQIGQCTSRNALHIAQVIQMAMHEGPDGPTNSRHPEDKYVPSGKSS